MSTLFAEVALSDTLRVQRYCVDGRENPQRARVQYAALEPLRADCAHGITLRCRDWQTWGVVGSHQGQGYVAHEAELQRAYAAILRAFPEVGAVLFEDGKARERHRAVFLSTPMPPEVLAQLVEAHAGIERAQAAYAALWEQLAGIGPYPRPPEAP